jgi:uncharacterized membrane protein
MSSESDADKIEQLQAILKQLSERLKTLEKKVEQLPGPPAEKLPPEASATIPPRAAVDDPPVAVHVVQATAVESKPAAQPPSSARVGAEMESPSAARAGDPIRAAKTPPSLAPVPGLNAFQKNLASLEKIVGGRWFTWAGALTMLVAIAFFIPWSWNYFSVPTWFKVLAMHLACFSVLGIGLWLYRRRLEVLAQAVVGLGIFAWYGTALAALRTFNFYGEMFGESKYVVTAVECSLITLVAIFFAVRRRSVAIILVGALGGYLNPILTSRGDGDYVVLFLYLAFLNVGLIASAILRQWNFLKLLALLATAMIFVAWISHAAEIAVWPLEWLAVLHGLIFWVGVTLPPLRGRQTTGAIDLLTLAGTSTGYMALTWYLFEGSASQQLGLVAGGLGLIHIALFLITRLRVTDDDRMPRTHLALAMLFFMLVPLLQLHDLSYLAMAWSLEGLACMAIGLFYADRQMLITVTILFVLASLRLFFFDFSGGSNLPGTHIDRAALLFFLSSSIMLCSGSLAWWLPRRSSGELAGRSGDRQPSPLELSVAGFALALGNVLLLSAIGCQWSGRLVLTLWTLDLLTLWMSGLVLRSRPVRWYAAILVSPLVLISMMVCGDVYPPPFQLIFNTRFGSLFLVAVTGLIISWGYRRFGLQRRGAESAGNGAGESENALQYIAGFFGCLILFVAICMEIDTWFGLAAQRPQPPFENMSMAQQATYSIVSTLFAVAIVVFGFLLRSRFYRILGLLAFAPILLKVFLVDLSQLDQLARILATFALGISLLGVSFLYQKIAARVLEAEEQGP